MYRIFLKPILFLFPPETIHRLVCGVLKIACAIPGVPYILKSLYAVNDPRLKRTVFGLSFQSPIGLAAGFDKDANFFDELGYFGFGFIEIGTVTPKAQPGNDKPRMFRLPLDEGLINRMGFNNEGALAAALRLKKRKTDIIIGGNIGKNKNTPNEDAVNDYKKCFQTLFDYVDYFAVNVSSPNTPLLRELQDKEPLLYLLRALQSLNNQKKKPKPILLKISPDLSNEQLDDIIDVVMETKIDGVIATNTTTKRDGLRTDRMAIKAIGVGGLSGRPLFHRSTEVIKYITLKSHRAFPVIAAGGVYTPEDAILKLQAGASLVQVYTGFTYEGPGIVKRIHKEILKQNLFT
ncbi:MAG: Dihydroorotate dehydrogenase (quinone) [Parcubacteria group bacterium GW2011_GWA1_47_11]|nr:MAG: Dihydroorotate dehydrogenase (quinone) [Parcubacteria group bacterium GW2011_GWA1_47_11]